MVTHQQSWQKVRHINLPTQCTEKPHVPTIQCTPKTQHIYSVQHGGAYPSYKGDLQNVKKKKERERISEVINALLLSHLMKTYPSVST